MTHQRTGWGHREPTKLLKLLHFDDIEMSFHLGNTTPNAAVMKWVFLLRVTLATKGTAEIKNAQIAPRSRLPLSLEPKVPSWSHGITTYRNVKNSPTLDASFIPSDALFLRGAGKRESRAWGRKRKGERRIGDGKWQYNMIWFVGQNGFSVPIFRERGDGDRERGRARTTEVGGGGGRSVNSRAVEFI